MDTNEKNTREENALALQTAQRMLMQRCESERSCFESMANLNRAALTMCLAPELDEGELAALCEVLLIQAALIDAGYAHYRLR